MPKSRPIKLWFADHWYHAAAPDYNTGKLGAKKKIMKYDFIYHFLASKFDIELDRKTPDFLICSIWGASHLRRRVPRIIVAGENFALAPQHYDWTFSFAPTDVHKGGKNYYFPTFILTGNNSRADYMQQLVEPVAPHKKDKFCAFLYSNRACHARNYFFHLLNERKRVDGLGHVCNNVNRESDRASLDWGRSAISLYRPYKFVIAFENSSSFGYITEKIMLAFLAGAVPIYWGAPDIADIFNPQAFINAHEFGSLAELADYVMQVESDDALYAKYRSAPPLRDNRLPDAINPDVLAQHFAHIFANPPAQPAWQKTLLSRSLPRLPHKWRRIIWKRGQEKANAGRQKSSIFLPPQ